MSEEVEHNSKNSKKNLQNIIKVENYFLEQYNIYVNGYINTKTQKPVFESKKLTSYYYLCGCCEKEIHFTRLSKFLHAKHEKGLYCQKCATKYNTQKEEYKQKQRENTKKAWENGVYDNMIKSEKFKIWGKNNCKNMLNKTKEEKETIAKKKLETWLFNHTEEERQEINRNRTRVLLEYGQIRGYNTLPYTFAKRFCTKEWKDIRKKILYRDKFTCQKCNRMFKKSSLCIHHIVPYRICKKDKEENLITLCKSCHSKVERFLEKNCILENNTIDVEKELNFIYENKDVVESSN